MARAKELLDQGELKRAHQEVREECVNLFKTKALGQDVTEYERHLRAAISKSSQKVKGHFTKFCEGKAREYLEPDLSELRKKLNANHYKSMDEVQAELRSLKESFLAHGPKFAGSKVIFAEVAEQMLVKAATHIVVTSKQDLSMNQKKLQERVDYLEEKSAQDKKDFL